jgi:hypothetical protein
MRGRGGLAGAVALVAVLAAGCGGPPGTGERQVGAEPRLVHVHEFPDTGHRLAPTTAHPVLTRQQAERTEAVRGYFRPDPPPELKLAELSNRFRDPTGPVLAWVAVDPDHPLQRIGGPDFGPGYGDDTRRCPFYVVVDATSGQGYGAWQTCDPPYRG